MSHPINYGLSFKPNMINRVIEFEVRTIDTDEVLFHGAGVLKLYVYRGSEVYYIIVSDNNTSSVSLEKYYFSTLHEV